MSISIPSMYMSSFLLVIITVGKRLLQSIAGGWEAWASQVGSSINIHWMDWAFLM